VSQEPNTVQTGGECESGRPKGRFAESQSQLFRDVVRSQSIGKHGDRERFGFQQHGTSSNNRGHRKTDRFHRVDNEVAVKCGAGCRFPHPSEHNRGESLRELAHDVVAVILLAVMTIVMVIVIVTVVMAEMMEDGVSTIGGDLVHLVTIMIAEKGKGLVTRVVGPNGKSLMDMEVLKLSWFSLKIVRHIIGGRVLIR